MEFDSFQSENALKRCDYDFDSAVSLLMNSYDIFIDRDSTNNDEMQSNLQRLMGISFEKKKCEHALRIN